MVVELHEVPVSPVLRVLDFVQLATALGVQQLGQFFHSPLQSSLYHGNLALRAQCEDLHEIEVHDVSCPPLGTVGHFLV